MVLSNLCSAVDTLLTEVKGEKAISDDKTIVTHRIVL